MKKILLSIFAVLFAFAGVQAQDVVLDFTTNDWGFPESKVVDGKTYTYTNADGYTVTVVAPTNFAYYPNGNYFLFGKTGAVLTLPVFDFAVSKIEIVGRSGASTSVKEGLYADDTKLTQFIGATGTNIFEISEANQAVGVVYSIKVESNSNAQITKINIYKAADSGESGGGTTDPEEPETPEIPEEPETPGLVTAPCYVKVTSAPADWSGKYLIVYEDGADAYVFKALEAANNYVDATIENGVILATEELNSVAVELAPMNSGYSVKTSAGYISGTKDNNKLNFNATTAQLNSVEFVDGEGVKITSNTSVFRFNSAKDNLRFRYFKSSTFESQKPIQLYKYTEPADSQPYTLTVTDAGYATLFLDFNAAIPTNVEAYTVTEVNNGYVTLTQVTGVLPANTGVIVKANTGDYTFAYSKETPATVTGNLLEGTVADKSIEGEAYVLGVDEEGVVGLYKAKMAGGVWLNNANKAYLPASKVPNKSAAFYGFDWNGTTGIDQITENREQSTVIYDLTGRRVEEITEPGIYIVGGRKVLVK